MRRRWLIAFTAAAGIAAPGRARAQAPTPPERGELDGGPGEGGPDAGWHVASGLRLEQWIAPAGDHLRFDVRLHLPEMALGKHLSVATFAWERLDVAEGAGRGESGTVYQLLGTRYRREADAYGYFVGAHVLTWSGHGRPVTPWLGLRLGPRDGPSISAEASLLGLGPQGGELLSPLDDADIGVAIEGPRIGPCQIEARGRVRDVIQPDRHQREHTAALGVELAWGQRRVFLGVGLQHLRRAAARDPGDMPGGPAMDPPPLAGRIESTAVMLQIDAETPLPRSLLSN